MLHESPQAPPTPSTPTNELPPQQLDSSNDRLAVALIPDSPEKTQAMTPNPFIAQASPTPSKGKRSAKPPAKLSA